MAIDHYSPCPGGLDKKIKFCCPDLLSDWQKIERMIEGEQFSACLQHVEALAAKHPGRACLLATKSMLLRSVGRLEEAQPVVAEFLEKHPDNPIALAESAILTSLTDCVAAMKPLEKAIAVTGDRMDRRVYQAMGIVAEALIDEGHPLAARSLAMSQLALDPEDRTPLGFLLEYNRSTGMPLILKEEWALDTAPESAPWQVEFNQAKMLVSHMQRSAAAAKLNELVEKYLSEPVLWRSLAIVRALLADEKGAVEALRHYAGMDVPLDDAVDAESLAIALSEDPLGDGIDVYSLEYTVQNVEEVQTGLLSSPRIAPMAIDPASMPEGEPPPKGAYHLLDRAVPLTHTGLTLDTVPRLLGHAILFGRQTDREARLLVQGVMADDLASVKEFLKDATGNWLEPPSGERVIDRVSATEESLHRNWRLPDDMTGEHFQQLSEQHWEKVLLEQLPQRPLPYLDGKSPQEAAGQPAYRAKMRALVALLDRVILQNGVRFDVERLRERFGLPVSEPIDPDQKPVMQVPLVRLARITVEKLSDELLLTGFHRALAFGARHAVKKLAHEVVNRPSLSGNEEQQHALMVLARSEENWDQAYQYLERGRQASKASGKSCAPWDLLELPARLQRGEGELAVQLIQHVQRDHGKEQGVANALVDLLMRFGVLRPDGTAALPMAREAEPSIVVPGQEGAQPGKLWTPDSQSPSGQKSALWTPDMG